MRGWDVVVNMEYASNTGGFALLEESRREGEAERSAHDIYIYWKGNQACILLRSEPQGNVTVNVCQDIPALTYSPFMPRSQLMRRNYRTPSTCHACHVLRWGPCRCRRQRIAAETASDLLSSGSATATWVSLYKLFSS